MSTLEHALSLAAKAHEGQMDKAGEPYILHPLRMMLKLNTMEERITAVLHDIVEDCGWSLDRIRAEGFSESVISAIESVSKKTGEDYDDFVMRAAAHPLGRSVKIADLEDNSDLSRIKNPAQRDVDWIEKYRRAITLLRQRTEE